MFPKRPPPRVFELAGRPVAAGVVLPAAALEFPAPENKPPPLTPVPVEAPVPEPKGLAPGGFGKPNMDPEIDKKKGLIFKTEVNILVGWCVPPVPPAAFAPVVLPNRPCPAVVPDVPGFEVAFENSPPPVAGPVGPVFGAGFAE
jgi:hypothetical protein